MDRTGVRSTNVVAVGWEPDEEGSANGTLEVEFRQGIVYQYADVPRFLYEQLLYAQSVGKFFNRSIAEVYDGQRIE